MDDNIETIESNDEAENVESKPLLSLFKRLIGNNTKKTQNTVLTNTQILKILQDEFNMDVSDLHELEVDIYLNVMKKFLKDWPQWDEFDTIINDLKTRDDNDGIKHVLEVKYKHLKDYLKAMLRAAEPIAKETVQSLPPDPAPSTTSQTMTKDSNDVVLEVCCTRAQLHQLIYRHPVQDVNTIFNIEDVPGPSRINLMAPSFNTIMNWWCFSLNINLSALALKRETVHELRHFLVNKNLNIKTEIPPQNTGFQENAMPNSKNVVKSYIFNAMHKIMYALDKTPYKYVIVVMMDMIKNDLVAGALDTLKVPAAYRQCFNRHSFVRYLNTDPDPDIPKNEKYDLHIEETVIPMYQFQILRVDHASSKINQVEKEFRDKIFIECSECKVKFRGLEILKEAQQHFQERHQNEPDWRCRDCHKDSSMTDLTNRRWWHSCTNKK